MCFVYLLANVMISTVIVMFSPLLLCVCVGGMGWGGVSLNSINKIFVSTTIWFSLVCVFWESCENSDNSSENKYTYICHEIDGMEWTFICLTDFVIPVHLCRNTKMCALFDIDLCLKQRRTNAIVVMLHQIHGATCDQEKRIRHWK